MIHIITGPPTAGKTTYVDAHAQPGDIRIDFDRIANTLAGKPLDNHDHTPSIATVTKAARQAAINQALKHPEATTWIIHTNPSRSTLNTYREHGATIHTINPGKNIVMQRCKNQRPPHILPIAAQWYDQHEKTTTTQRGYGGTHQKTRKRLLAHHIDGTPCQHCGKPMFKDPTKNFDHAPLEADHPQGKEQARMGHVQKRTNHATRLLHRRCNRQLGAQLRNELNGYTPTIQAPTFNWA